MTAQAKTSERQFWVVSKAGVDFGRRSKANAKRLTCGVERLNSDFGCNWYLLLLVTRGENVEKSFFCITIRSLNIYSTVEG